MGNLTCTNVRESAYDACSESSPKQKEAEYGDRATCVVHTWRVSSFMFTQGRLAMPPVRRGCHGTRHSLFCAGWWAEVDGAREGEMKRLWSDI